MSVSHDQLVKALAKPGEAIIKELTPESAHLLHMAIGVSGECYELFEAATINQDIAHCLEELGDVEFYFEGVRQWGSFVIHHSNTPPQPSHNPLMDMLHHSGELLDLAKKVAFYGDASKYAKIGITAQKLRTALCQVYMVLNLTYEEAVEHNINKLTKRYGEALEYSNEAAINRKDKA